MFAGCREVVGLGGAGGEAEWERGGAAKVRARSSTRGRPDAARCSGDSWERKLSEALKTAERWSSWKELVLSSTTRVAP